MNRVDQAVALMAGECNCAKAVLAAYAPELGLDPETAKKLAAAFGGGIGSTGETCGAVTGALMALGLWYGREASEREADQDMYAVAGLFLRRFHARNGTTLCRELLGADQSTTQGLQVARNEGLFTTRCPDFVRDAAEILKEMIEA